ncbi:response regulator [Microvirga guangxiensis]|uniref:CheY chemotaxis protein or a CheY-like REC (Receiver) domain n=1 Tax=Microvirga guangxiensis TaxID=549386 RepID=A0A1G5CNL7_9HYPH|nr:response regulator [Microvirga guangxiensis]SCY04149.1 CheY chemotaxis protein or a CheY-like REC (receiver) domain [Microvirga guangxiensis]
MRILILEDDPFIASDLQSILEDEGHEVVGVFDSIAETYQHLEDEFDYALLDIDVVGGKSFGVANALAERSIPFAFVSASKPGDLPQSLREVAFIPKPFEERAILQSIDSSSSRSYSC